MKSLLTLLSKYRLRNESAWHPSELQQVTLALASKPADHF